MCARIFRGTFRFGENIISFWKGGTFRFADYTLAAALAPVMGLNGVWLAMCIELCFRGIIFLIRLEKGNWMKIKR